MKNTPEDQLLLDFDNISEVSGEGESRKSSAPLTLVHSRKIAENASPELSIREKILDDVLTYARSLKW